jgi:hypothetical protein
MSAYQTLTVETSGRVAIVTFRRADQLNAMNRLMQGEITAAFEALSEDDSVGAIVVTGDGRGFMAGADIKEYAAQTGSEFDSFQTAGTRMYASIEDNRKPVIAAVNGFALGGGIAGPGTYTLRNTVIANNAIVDGTPSNCGLGGGIGLPLNIIDQGGNLQYPGSDCGRWITWATKFGTTRQFWRPDFATASIDPLLPLDARGVFVPLPRGPAIDIGSSGCGPTDQTGRASPLDGNGDGFAVCDAGAVESP